MTKQEYQEYPKSDHWKDVKSHFKQSRLNKGKCGICRHDNNKTTNEKVVKENILGQRKGGTKQLRPSGFHEKV